MATAMAMADYSDVDYFEEASSSIELVQQLASHQVQLNLFQCQYLASKLAETGSFLKAQSETLKDLVDRNDIRRKALLMLHFTVKRAEKLVRNCCCDMESWLESAVTLAQIKEDIVDILLDLRWWTSMVNIAIASVTWMSSEQQIELELLMCAEEDFESLLKQLQMPSNELDKAVTKDKDQLMKRLRDVQVSYGGRDGDPHQNRQYLLAAHVQSRLENKVFETMGDAWLNVFEDSRMIGQGGFGAVMDVRWLGRRCALKMLKYKCTREATSLSAFQHPHIVQFFRYWEAPYDTTSSQKELQSHILMELLPTDLAEYMKALIKANGMKVRVGSKRRQDSNQELPISEDAAIDVMLQIAKAVWHLNSKDVAHRDLKPNNVLVRLVSEDEVPELSARGYLRVKLGDFGLAKTKAYSQASSKQTGMIGTKIYGAPEVFTTEVFSEKKFPRRADVWSFGIMFNEVLSGKPPFEPADGQKISGLQGRIRKGWRPALPENCPDYLKFCITSCWELRPQDRPNFTDLWKMVRFAQVRSLGLIRENHDLFTFKTRDSVKRLRSFKRSPSPCSDPLPDNKGSFKSISIWLFIWRITYLVKRRDPINQSSHSYYRQKSNAGNGFVRSSLDRDDKPLGYLVNPVWPLQHTTDSKLDLIFFEGNVGRRRYLSCKDTWVQRGKPDVWWPQDWLQKDFKGDIRVLLLEYSISEAGVEGVVEELQRLLVFSDRCNRGHTWQRPIVLVGHSLGCVVIEQLVVALHKKAEAIGSLKDEMEIARAKVSRAFLASLTGCFFYAPPLKGLVPSEDLLKHVFGGLTYSRALFADLCLDSTKLKQVSEEFMQARSEHVKVIALIEGFHTRGRTVVPPASMEGFAGEVVELLDSNHSDACKPTNKEHPAYAKLIEFIQDVSNAKKDLDESPIALASQMSLSEGFHSTKSTTKENRAYQKVVGLLGIVLKVRKVMSGPGHFYGNQCNVLKEQLSLAKEILIKGRESRVISTGDPLWPKLALTELHRLVKLGRTLIKDCHHDKLCLKAYLRQGERAQAFSEILKEIVWCKSVVGFYHDNMEQVFSTAMDEFSEFKLGDEELYLLQNAAGNDQKELLASLDSWIRKHPCSAKECGRPLSQHQANDADSCLAAQISDRVNNSEGGATSEVKDDHTTVLWKTSQSVLEDGTVIGSGSSGTVTETTWLGDKYAKKEFDMVPTEFEDEANALAKLNHPHIVKVSAYCVGSHTCFFLMDRMPGNLRKYMNNRVSRLRINQPFSLLAAVDLMLQISEAMSYMNSKGMVHRDLKPLNILVKPVYDADLCQEGFVIAKLADFGLAKSKNEITSHSHLTRENLGTSKWRAPEMFKVAQPSTENALPWQADVYSFGIVCSEILTGKLPFHHVIFKMEDLYSLLTHTLKPLRPELPEKCPKSLTSLICQCWLTIPKMRPSFEEVSRRLRHLKGQVMMSATNHLLDFQNTRVQTLLI
ncbi:hypothetical protein KC19_2G119000 [Ceratodon purpureus]|uniref:Protein kinase domain-containing protein n=1 Tax=Ceratodon purpureus TaxID=3225 RepID=A0A8T0IVH2_CERPU|nr:hypothetical protein KC19_2G119000 [Ceratodon purpureus]